MTLAVGAGAVPDTVTYQLCDCRIDSDDECDTCHEGIWCPEGRQTELGEHWHIATPDTSRLECWTEAELWRVMVMLREPGRYCPRHRAVDCDGTGNAYPDEGLAEPLRCTTEDT